jgi:GNAT superfamily N-acetyltransferase
MAIPMTPALVAELERSELRAWSTLYRNAPPTSVAVCGIGIRDFGAATALWMSRVDVLACNRVLGLGLDGAPDARAMDEIVAAYEQAMVPRFFVQPAPVPAVAPTVAALEKAGFAHYNNWIRLVRDVAPPGPAPTSLRVEEVGPAHAAAFGETLCQGFGWSPELGAPVAALVGTAGWKFYLAFDGDRAVGTAALAIDGKVGWLSFASTLPEARGLGSQSALVARRIMDAKSAGCEILSVETSEETPEKEAPSYRNIMRSGFQVGYVRPNYLYRFRGQDQG